MAENVVARILAKIDTADTMADAGANAMTRAEASLYDAMGALQVTRGSLYAVIGDEQVGALLSYNVAMQSAIDMCQAAMAQVQQARGNIVIGKGYGEQFRTNLRRDITG